MMHTYSPAFVYAWLCGGPPIELDEDLLARAKEALGQTTTRSTVEKALRRALADVDAAHAERVARQRRYLDHLAEHVDLEVLASGEMWR
jgi:Arc/MetJ family transcription regulator